MDHKHLLSRRGPAASAALALLLLFACDRAATDPSTEPGPPARVEVVGGDGQADSVLATLPEALVVRVLDEGGRPVAGAAVSWSVDPDGGTVAPASPVTGADGVARASWTLGAKADRVRATARSGDALVELTATARPGSPVSLAVWGDTARAMMVGDTASGLVAGADRHGNRVPSARLGLSWSSSHPDVAAVDSAGLVRALAWGAARLVASSGARSFTIPLVVHSPAVSVFPIDSSNGGMVFQFHQNGGRLSAVGAVFGHDRAVSSAAYDFDGGRWRRSEALAMDFSGTLSGHHIHVSAQRLAFSSTRERVFRSAPGGPWSEIPSLRRTNGPSRAVAGVGDTVFAIGADGLSRIAPGEVLSVGGGLPFVPLEAVAVSSREIYAVGADSVMRWDGSSWATLTAVGGTQAVRLLRIASRPGSRGVLGLSPLGIVVTLEQGRATRMQLPEIVTERYVVDVRAGPGGAPYLVMDGGVVWQDRGAWRELRWSQLDAPQDWRLSAFSWVDDDGSLWLVYTRLLSFAGHYPPREHFAVKVDPRRID